MKSVNLYESRFQLIFTGIFFILAVGTPLIFTSLTRSVFEVNKLLLLRYCTLLTIGISLFRALLYRDNNVQIESANPSTHYQLFGFQWRKIGIEIPMIVWLIFNGLSTLFSQNILISVYGAYDRWEGIITVTNYMILIVMLAKLIQNKRHLLIILLGIIGSTLLSSLYGVWQSLGLDFMNWSVDPTKRVFACINNPVHFCAYVAMVIPISISASLFFSEKIKTTMPNALSTRLIWPIFVILYTTYYWYANILPSVLYIPILGISAIVLIFNLRRVLSIYPLSNLAKVIIFICINIIYFTQYLSFSRATWMGFIGAMTLFFCFMLNLWATKSIKRYYIDIIITCLTIALFYLVAIFNIHTISTFAYSLLMILLGGCLTILFLLEHFETSSSKKSADLIAFFQNKWSDAVLLFTSFLLTRHHIVSLISIITPAAYYDKKVSLVFILISLISNAALFHRTYHSNAGTKKTLLKLTLIILFAKLQFITDSYFTIYQFFMMLMCLYLCLKTPGKPLVNHSFWLFNYIIIFGLILIIPVVPGKLRDTLNSPLNQDIIAKDLAQERIKSYKSVAIEGTARTSMWRSSIPWTKDYWLLGSGLDTIKYMYPVYRESVYGILEGGHNFTPDRLHNEYLNSLATRGIPSTLIYYLLIIGLPLFYSIRLFYTSSSSFRLISIGCSAGALIYLGQVLFNFGVVATLVLFYFCIGLSLSIKTIIEREGVQ